ncbi:MAG: hypothetical protein LBK27_00765 [Treponema sp.]|jgi:hypothetical protein|nr:hypothetical protein [Treponema sp.]
MEVPHFSAARDLLYLGGAMLGLAAGFMLSLFKKHLSIRSRNRRITLIFLAFSGVLAAFSAAVAVSCGGIFSQRGLFLLALAGAPVFALAVLFPRVAAYPLMLAGGLLAVWLGYSFLRFPPAGGEGAPLVYVHHEGAGVYSIRLPAGSGAQAGDRAAVFQLSGNQSSLTVEGARIGFPAAWPLVGGADRGIAALVRRGDEVLYADRRLETPLLKNWYARLGRRGIVFQNAAGTVPLGGIPRGADMAVFFSGGALSSRLVRPVP